MMQDIPETSTTTDPVEPHELKQQIDQGDHVAILDVRNSEDFEEWKIDGENIEIVNIPYFEFLDGDIETLLDDVPDDPVVLCAKGESSRFVAGLLKEHGHDPRHLEEGMNGWARIYESAKINDDPLILQYQRPSSGCLGYMVISKGEAAVIDPLRAFTDQYIDDAREHGATITHVLDTHVHADHISGLRALADETGAMAIMSENAIERGVTYDDRLKTTTHGDTVQLGDTAIDVIATPGHTTGMTSYRVEDTLFTGDGLFTESVARPDLEDGEEGAEEAARMLYDSLHERILDLPDDTVVAPAHFSDAAEAVDSSAYVRELGDLRNAMEALHMDREDFVNFIVTDMPPRPANYQDIIATNLGQHKADDEEAFELELGPNNCAASKDSMTA